MLKVLGIITLTLIVGLIIFLTFSIIYNKIVISQIPAIKQHSYNLASEVNNKDKTDQVEEEATISGEVQIIKPDSEWITYVQPEDGYSFLYPKGWFLKTCSNGNYMGNLHLDPEPLEDKCISDTPPKNVPLVSVFAIQGQSIEELINEAKQNTPQPFFEIMDKKTVIDGREYKQIVEILNFIPAFFEGVPIPTKSVITYVDFPEKNQVIIVAFGALDDESENADIYRQILSSIKKTN